MNTKQLNSLIATTYPDGAPNWMLRDMELIATLTAEMINAQGRDKVNFYRNEIQLTKAPIIRQLVWKPMEEAFQAFQADDTPETFEAYETALTAYFGDKSAVLFDILGNHTNAAMMERLWLKGATR